MLPLQDLKYIFVCYPHGGGGEFLSYIISKAEECNTLVRRKVGNRTKVQDIFNQHMLRMDFNIDRCFSDYGDNGDLSAIDENKYVVVPTHYRENVVGQHFKNYKFVNILYPQTEEGHKRVLRNVKNKVWYQPQPTQLEFFGMLQQLEKEVGNRDWFVNTHFSMNTIDIILASQGKQLTDEDREQIEKDWDNDIQTTHEQRDNNLCIEYENVANSLKQIGEYLGITITEEMQEELNEKIKVDEKI